MLRELKGNYNSDVLDFIRTSREILNLFKHLNKYRGLLHTDVLEHIKSIADEIQPLIASIDEPELNSDLSEEIEEKDFERTQRIYEDIDRQSKLSSNIIETIFGCIDEAPLKFALKNFEKNQMILEECKDMNTIMEVYVIFEGMENIMKIIYSYQFLLNSDLKHYFTLENPEEIFNDISTYEIQQKMNLKERMFETEIKIRDRIVKWLIKIFDDRDSETKTEKEYKNKISNIYQVYENLKKLGSDLLQDTILNFLPEPSSFPEILEINSYFSNKILKPSFYWRMAGINTYIYCSKKFKTKEHPQTRVFELILRYKTINNTSVHIQTSILYYLNPDIRIQNINNTIMIPVWIKCDHMNGNSGNYCFCKNESEILKTPIRVLFKPKLLNSIHNKSLKELIGMLINEDNSILPISNPKECLNIKKKFTINVPSIGYFQPFESLVNYEYRLDK